MTRTIKSVVTGALPRSVSTRCSLAGAGLALILTVGGFVAAWVVILKGTPDFVTTPLHRWLVELFFLWCLPFFMTVWRLTAAVLEERNGQDGNAASSENHVLPEEAANQHGEIRPW